MEARVTISKETMNKNKLDNRTLRKLRLDKLQELDTEGKLSKATCRTDITKMLGFSGGYDRGYSWLCKIIGDGTLSETFLGMNSQGKPEYEYHMKSKPQTKVKTTVVPKVKPVTTPVILGRAYAMPDDTSNSKVVIRYKELVIEIENVDCNLITDIVSKLADK